MLSPAFLPTWPTIHGGQFCCARHQDKGPASGELQLPAILSHLSMVHLIPIVSLVKLLSPKHCSHPKLPSFSKEDRRRQKQLLEKSRRKGILERRHQSWAAIRPQKDESSMSKADPHTVMQVDISRHLLSHGCIAPATGT